MTEEREWGRSTGGDIGPRCAVSRAGRSRGRGSSPPKIVRRRQLRYWDEPTLARKEERRLGAPESAESRLPGRAQYDLTS